MAEGPADDQMIEIGDPTEEPAAEEPAPQVVIEYHERGGVPWMLIPPLLVISAVGAVLLYHKLAPHTIGHDPASLSKVVQSLGPPPDEAPKPSVPPVETPPEPVAKPDLVAGPWPKPDATAEVVVAPANPVEPVAPPADPVPQSIEPPKGVEPAPFPRVGGLGFDPKALEAERKAEATADPALAPVFKEDRPDDRNLPREIDPDLLPPDPRQAKLRQEQRRLEVLRRVEEERSRFHADLKVICRKFREDCGPEILEMRKQYDLKVDPKAEKAAVQILGKNGKFAGADRRVRIELLRGLGYPEPVILDNLFVNYEKKQIGERDGPRDIGEAYYFASLFLLRNPPRPLPSPSRPVSAPGNGAGPIR